MFTAKNQQKVIALVFQIKILKKKNLERTFLAILKWEEYRGWVKDMEEKGRDENYVWWRRSKHRRSRLL